jgi:hypothetical protein
MHPCILFSDILQSILKGLIMLFIIISVIIINGDEKHGHS